MQWPFPIQKTRNRLIRILLKILGRFLLPLFARINVTGRENFPRKGPAILAGNHVAFLEVALMVVYPPYLVELIGTGDIPLDPTFAPLANLYGFIPINRGNLDRAGMNQALSVLKQDGILAIFPEGGIWQPEQMQAQVGVSWLSSQAQAPVIPIGFGGMRGAISAMVHLRRPILTMNIGEPIPPIQITQRDLSRKAALITGANLVMKHIQELIPIEEQIHRQVHTNQRFALEISVYEPDGRLIACPSKSELLHSQQLAQLFMQPVLMNVFVHNLRMMMVMPLQNLSQIYPAEEIQSAVQAILDYLEINRGFLTYRFGMETGLAMQSGLNELLQFTERAAQSDYDIRISPIYYYTDAEGHERNESGSQCIELR
jgi:1-acyl-sn-glycerol-3-phosphate acyltransferase